MRFILVCAALSVPLDAARAQLALPGATAPSAIGSVVKPPEARKPRSAEGRLPAAATTPAESNIAGKTFYLNGGKSQIAFVPRDKTVDLSRLLFQGVKISNGRDFCEVDVQGMPLTLAPAPSIKGLHRFSIPLPVCPMSFDVLDGAILMAADAGKCSFTEADCEVAPNGLWGPAPGELGPDQVKLVERERMRAERDLRAAYKGLVGSTKDRAVIRTFAADQAGFSSRREEMCRDYIGESRHGFCASRLTESRAAELQTAYGAAAAAKPKSKKRP